MSLHSFCKVSMRIAFANFSSYAIMLEKAWLMLTVVVHLNSEMSYVQYISYIYPTV